jgi:hypothetical protein
VGGRRASTALVGVVCVGILVIVVLGLVVSTLLRQRPTPGPGVFEPDSVRVLSCRWTGGKPNTFRIRVRLYRQDHQPILGWSFSPSLIDAGTNGALSLVGNTTYFENWNLRAPGNSFEGTIRAQLASTPTVPVSIGFNVLHSVPLPPAPLWERVLMPWNSPPQQNHLQFRLAGKPAVLQPPARQKASPREAD